MLLRHEGDMVPALMHMYEHYLGTNDIELGHGVASNMRRMPSKKRRFCGLTAGWKVKSREVL